jgi:hypothetical protein
MVKKKEQQKVTNLQEKAIRLPHNIGFVDCRYPFPAISLGIMESILCHSQTSLAGNDFQTFNNTSHNLEKNQHTMKRVQLRIIEAMCL